MLAFLTQVHADQISLATLVGLMVVSVIRGWVVPRSVLRDRVADKDTQIAALILDRDAWKDAFFKKGELAAEQSKQIGDLVDSGETTVRLMDTLRNEIQRSGIQPSGPRQDGG